jgi:uncharacterized membrane protein YgcG
MTVLSIKTGLVINMFCCHVLFAIGRNPFSLFMGKHSQHEKTSLDTITLIPSYPSLDECENWRSLEFHFSHNLEHGARIPADYEADLAEMLARMTAHILASTPEPAEFSCSVAHISLQSPSAWRWPCGTREPPLYSIVGVWVRPCAMRRGVFPRILLSAAAALHQRNRCSSAAATAAVSGAHAASAPAGLAIRACGGNCRRAVASFNSRSAARGGASLRAMPAPGALDADAAEPREDWALAAADLPRLRFPPHRSLPPAAELDPRPWSPVDTAEWLALRLARRLATRADPSPNGAASPVEMRARPAVETARVGNEGVSVGGGGGGGGFVVGGGGVGIGSGGGGASRDADAGRAAALLGRYARCGRRCADLRAGLAAAAAAVESAGGEGGCAAAERRALRRLLGEAASAAAVCCPAG